MSTFLARVLIAILAVTILAVPVARSAPTLETLYSFYAQPGHPESGVIKAADGNFYGTTTQGGGSGYGTIFKITPSGVLTILVEFTSNGTQNKGARPNGLIQGKDGNFYGTTRYGGASNLGTIFKMTPAGVLTTLVEFDDATFKGESPGAALVQGKDGNFYGTTSGGGAKFAGTVFKMTPAGKLTTMVEFTGYQDGSGNDPEAALIQTADGNIYGTTWSGGASDLGTVFKMTPAGAVTTLVHFSGSGATNNGSYPTTALVQGSDGNFYGTTSMGGTTNFGNGTVFKMTPAGGVTTLVQFTGNGPTNKGAGPSAPLVQQSNGDLYGTTGGGGTNGGGTVFKVTPAGVLTTLVNSSGNPSRGALAVAGNGNFYGTTNSGGYRSRGTFFEMTPDGASTNLVEFGNEYVGAYPQAALLQGSDGGIYGTTSQGGFSNGGTVFRMTTSGVLKTLVQFIGYAPSGSPATPTAAMVQGSDGNFYGTTHNGGITDNFDVSQHGYGTVFRMTATGVTTTLVKFNRNAETDKGSYPSAELVQGSDGNFYGTTGGGGTSVDVDGSAEGYGTIFRMTPAGALTTLINFDATHKGIGPNGLLQGSDGNFYGTTARGGATGLGTVFRMTPAGELTTLVEFTGLVEPNKGAFPGGLVKGSDGNYYGMTESGGITDANDTPYRFGYGTVYKMTPAGVLTTLVEFTGTTAGNKGSFPHGKLVQGSDGNFYGTTSSGGTHNAGTAFMITPAGILTTLVNFAPSPDPIGSNPQPGLLKANDNNLYGTTSSGGAGGFGTVFRLRFGLLGNAGSLQTSITPPAAITAGAQWRVDGGPWQESGATVAGVSVGNHTVTFKPITGWLAPGTRILAIEADKTTTTTGVYRLNPTIAVEQPAGNVLQTGVSSIDFGSVAAGNSRQLTFVVRNAGDENLTVSGLSMTGVNASEFKSGTFVKTILAAGGATTFTMTFSPKGGWARSAILHVKSNDLATPSFTIKLTGQGVVPPTPNGTFTGLLAATDGNPLHGPDGWLTLTVTPAGSFTGRIVVGNKTVSFKSSFDANGDVIGTFGGMPVVLHRSLVGSSYSVTGTVNGIAVIANHTAYGNHDTVLETGRYTILLMATDPSPTIPQGTGWASLVISKTGIGTLVLTLADNTVLSGSSPLVASGAGRQFILYNAAAYGGKGLAAGALTLAAQTYSDLTGTLKWLKPKQTNAPYYGDGFNANPMVVGVGSATPAKNTRALSFTDGVAHAKIRDVSFIPAIDDSITLSILNKIVVGSANTEKLTITVNLASGTFTGSFVHPTGHKLTSFRGALYQNMNAPQAGGFYLSPIINKVGYSGAVILTP